MANRLLNWNGVRLIFVGHVLVLYYILALFVFKSTHDTNQTTDADELNCLHEEDVVGVGYNGYGDDVKAKLAELIRRQAGARDRELVSLVRRLMKPPSKHMVKIVRRIVETPQSRMIWRLLNNKKNGFFVEAGALDGERSSNTLFLEQRLGWSGLLIEADPYFYTQLIGKSRKSWTINACIGTSQHPTMMNFKESSGGSGQLVTGNQERKANRKDGVISVPCFALETMLLALKKTNIDYFSLDVEGFELEVLQTIPFERINITSISVEYVHGRSGKEHYKTFMEGKGYRLHKDIHLHKPDISLYVDDFIFVKNRL